MWNWGAPLSPLRGQSGRGQLWAETPEHPGLPADPDAPEEKATPAARAPRASHLSEGSPLPVGSAHSPFPGMAPESACVALVRGQTEVRSPWVSSSSSPICTLFSLCVCV